jgi:hypothetical protein
MAEPGKRDDSGADGYEMPEWMAEWVRAGKAKYHPARPTGKHPVIRLLKPVDLQKVIREIKEEE